MATKKSSTKNTSSSKSTATKEKQSKKNKKIVSKKDAKPELLADSAAKKGIKAAAEKLEAVVEKAEDIAVKGAEAATEKIEAAAEKVEDLAARGAEAAAEKIEAVSEKVEDLAAKGAKSAIDKGEAIAEKIEDLAEKIEAVIDKNVEALAAENVDAVVVKGPDAVMTKGVDAIVAKGVDAVVARGVGAVVIKDEASAPSVKESIAPVIKNTATPTIKTEGTLSTQESARVEQSSAMHTEINPYLPNIATISEIIKETHNIVTLRVVIDDAHSMANFSFKAGQVGQLSLFGIGEATFVINSPPSCKKYLQFSIMKTGEVTNAIHKLSPGDKIGVRGPLGNSFPWESWKGKDIFFVGGGIGMAPIRTIMLQVLEHSSEFGKISLLYGARTPLDMAFSYELDEWMSRKDLDCTLTIDAPSDGWKHKVGLIPNILTELAPDPAKSIAVLCGPPIMIKFTVQALEKLKFSDASIFTTLEKRMKCGIGLCGRCNIGGKYVCIDGPVFSWAELKDLPPEL